MKANSYKPILLFILIFSFSRIFALQATVNSLDARMEIEDSKKRGGFLVLPPGTVVQIDRSAVGFFHIIYNGISGWIRKDHLAVYDGVLSDLQPKPFLSKKIIRENGKDYLFLFKKGKLIKYNITDRIEEVSQNVPDFQEIYPSSRGNLFLLRGVSTNRAILNNLELYDFLSGKSAYVGSFRDSTFEISDIKFSEDANFVGILFIISGHHIICIYRTDSGAFYTYSTDALQFNWKNSLLVLNDNRYFWAYDLSSPLKELKVNFNKDNLLIKIRPEWGLGNYLKSVVRDDSLYIATRQGIVAFDLNLKTLRKTPFKGLIFNNDMNLNYYFENERGRMYNFRLRHDIGIFSGAQPEAVFEAFTESNIIGRAKYEKIDTLFLYSDNGDAVYRYKAVDNPMAFGDTGITAEINTEKDLTILSIEDPDKGEFFYIFDRGGK